MTTNTLSRLDMSKVRQVIAMLTQIPEKQVIDGSTYTDTSVWAQFITVTPLTSESIGVEAKFDAENNREIITSTRETMIAIKAYGEVCYLLIEDLSTQLQTYIAQQLFKVMGGGFVCGSEIKHYPEDPIEGKPQATQLNLTLSHIHRIESSLTHGESVIISTLKESI